MFSNCRPLPKAASCSVASLMYLISYTYSLMLFSLDCKVAKSQFDWMFSNRWSSRDKPLSHRFKVVSQWWLFINAIKMCIIDSKLRVLAISHIYYGFEGCTVCIKELLPCILFKGRLNLFTCTQWNYCFLLFLTFVLIILQIKITCWNVIIFIFKLTVYIRIPQQKLSAWKEKIRPLKNNYVM